MTMPIFRSDLIALFDALGVPNLGHAAPAAILTRVRGMGINFLVSVDDALPKGQGLGILAQEIARLANGTIETFAVTEDVQRGPAKRLGSGGTEVEQIAQGIAEGIVAQAMKLAEAIVQRAMSEMPSSRLDQLEKLVAALELFNSGKPE